MNDSKDDRIKRSREKLRKLFRYGIDNLNYSESDWEIELRGETVSSSKNSAYKNGLAEWRKMYELEDADCNLIFYSEWMILEDYMRDKYEKEKLKAEKENWISAYEARNMVRAAKISTNAICKRAYDGLVKARAVRFVQGSAVVSGAEIPKELWWARGEAALTQDWETGDFETWFSGQLHLRAFGVEFRRIDIESMLPVLPPSKLPDSNSSAPKIISNKIFVVHGRDNDAKNEVARFLSKIGLEEIILHERPNQGRHLLTKFQDESEGASFAVILMTPDDEGGLPGASLKKRARQNVVFELGFFIGRMGTSKVAALVKGEVEKPSDFDGVGYITLDPSGDWKRLLARELKAAKMPFDHAKVFEA